MGDNVYIQHDDDIHAKCGVYMTSYTIDDDITCIIELDDGNTIHVSIYMVSHMNVSPYTW